MSIELVAEVWDNIKHVFAPSDRKEAAEAVVSVLFENNFEVDEIRDAFRGDSDIRRAAKQYEEEHGTTDEDEEEEDYEEDDERW